MAVQPNLQQLRNSHDATPLDEDIKDVFLFLFETYIRVQERRINMYGIPHRGDITTIERFVKQEGLTLFKRSVTTEPYMREILRAWRGIHSRRGLGFLNFYLQLLWPNSFQFKELWQIKALPYPTGLSVIEGSNKFLTSRRACWLNVEDVPDLDELIKISHALRQVVPARIVLDISLYLGWQNNQPDSQVLTANAGTGTVCCMFEDTSIDSSTIVAV